MAEEKQSIFKTLQGIDLTEKHKNKGKLTYLPWASAWTAVKLKYPDATFTIVKDENDNLYHTDGRTCYVETVVTIEGQSQTQTLAVMDNVNKAITLEKVTSTDVQKSIARCLTKNLALFGLDLNLWVGEELSDEAKDIKEQAEKEKAEQLKAKKDEVVAAGNKLIESGVDKEEMLAVVGKYNEGVKNPRSIQSVEVGDQILEEFKKLKPKAKRAAPKQSAAKETNPE